MLQMSRVQLVHLRNRIDSLRFTAFAGSLEDRGLVVGGPRALQNLRCSSLIGEGEDRGGRTEKDDSGQKLEPSEIPAYDQKCPVSPAQKVYSPNMAPDVCQTNYRPQ